MVVIYAIDGRHLAAFLRGRKDGVNKPNRTECTHLFLPGGLHSLARITLDPEEENRVPKGMPPRHVPSIVWAPLSTVKQRRSWPAFLTRVTACVAPRRSIRKERAEKRIGEYG